LVLEDGAHFRGQAYGAAGEAFGEAVFATGMSGYQETLTDPSYHRQILVFTSPHIGNTGWNDEDGESDRIWTSGLVVRDPVRQPSSWRARRSLDDVLAEQGTVGIAGIDTRALTRRLRERGSMRAGLSTVDLDPASLLTRVLASPPMAGADLVGDVTTSHPYVVPASGPARHVVAAYDLGLKAMTPALMRQRGLTVHVLPAGSGYADIAALRPDGVFFSNGPGDPAAADQAVALVRQVLAAQLPFFGICFGHQIFGRALDFDTYKLKYGHRGLNQPVKDLATGTVAITSHNHGFAVAAPPGEDCVTPYGLAKVSHIDLNDNVVEGLELRDKAGRLLGFSVQYHPEAAAGPHDAAYLFDRFAALMAERRASTETGPAGAITESGPASGSGLDGKEA
jgi:carbamoyl-phosphate synthase small subunit